MTIAEMLTALVKKRCLVAEGGDLTIVSIPESQGRRRAEVYFQAAPNGPESWPIAWVGLDSHEFMAVKDNPMHPQAKTDVTLAQIKLLEEAAAQVEAAVT